MYMYIYIYVFKYIYIYIYLYVYMYSLPEESGCQANKQTLISDMFRAKPIFKSIRFAGVLFLLSRICCVTS